MVIAVTHIKKTRKRHTCNICDRWIAEGSPAIDMYGAAEYGDKPYHIKFHQHCWNSSPSRDVVKHQQACETCKEAMNGSNPLAQA